MMKTKYAVLHSLIFSVLAAVTAVFPASAEAALVAYNFPLEEVQTEPRSGASGSGMCDVVLNTATGEVSVSCSFSGLDSDATAAHIHGLAPAGVAAGVIVPLSATASTSGTISGDGILTPDQVQGALDGLTYVNLHTVNDAPGALRGQIVGRVSPPSASLPTMSTPFMVAMAALLLLVGTIALRRHTRG